MFTKKMAQQNREIETRAMALLPQKTEVQIVAIIKGEFPEVSGRRVHRLVDKINRFQSVRQMTNHGGARFGSGPKTKAERGLEKYKRLSITLPPELWSAIETKRAKDEGTSELIRRLLSKSLL